MSISDSTTPASATYGAGQVLRSAREKSGRLINEISVELRIAEHNLQAIEEGRFSDLPAPAYAIGFVRAYADYLELDSGEVVRRLKLELADIDSSRGLIFPQPPGDERSPSRALLWAALLMAVVVYGIWYVNSLSSRTVEMAPAGEAPPVALSEAPASDVAAPVPLTPLAPPTPLDTDIAPATDAADEAVSPDTTPAPVELEFGGADSAPEVDSQAALPQTEENNLDGTDPAEISLMPRPKPVRAPLPESSGASPESAIAPEPLAPSQPSLMPPSAIQPSSIMLRARADSWIQVSRANGAVLISRVLHAGEEYIPPNEPGLSLMTGNAGALEVYVNGQAMPSIGPRGAIVRALPLDPESLIATGSR